MNLQEKMFAEVESWVASGELKTAFLEGKDQFESTSVGKTEVDLVKNGSRKARY